MPLVIGLTQGSQSSNRYSLGRVCQRIKRFGRKICHWEGILDKVVMELSDLSTV